MMKRIKIIPLFLIIISMNLVSCDPEEIARRKTPAPIKSALTFAEAPDDGGREKQTGKKTGEPKLAIVSPKDGAVYPVGKPLIFRAKAVNKLGYPPEGSELIWKCVDLKSKKNINIGKGLKVVKELEPGPYQITATMLYDKRQVKVKGKPKVKYNHMVKKVNIRVAMSISGKVESGGKGLPGAELILTDNSGKKVFEKIKSGPTGEFSMEFPQHTISRLTIRKPGYSFTPLQKVFEFQGKSENVVFKGAKADIQDIMLTSDPGSNQPIKELCPEQELYFKAGFESDRQVQRVEAFLVQTTTKGKVSVLLGEAIEPGLVPNTLDPNAPQSMAVKIPERLKPGAVSDDYNIVVTYYDSSGDSFSGISDQQVKLSPSSCAKKVTLTGVKEQRQGNNQKAIELYDKAEKYGAASSSAKESPRYKELRLFNRGLAHLSMAIESKSGGLNEIGHLNKSLADFSDVLDMSRRDAQALLMRGVASYLRGNYDMAIAEISKAIKISPDLAAGHKIRGMAYIKTQDPDNLSKAIDDFTAALSEEKNNDSLRRMRKETLIHDIELADAKASGDSSDKRPKSRSEEIKVDSNKIRVPDLTEVVDFTEFVRKSRN